MTHDEARAIIREYYGAIAQTGNEQQLRQAVAYLSAALAEHMAWDSAVWLAEWIKGRTTAQVPTLKQVSELVQWVPIDAPQED
jgi:hypothetical protein